MSWRAVAVASMLWGPLTGCSGPAEASPDSTGKPAAERGGDAHGASRSSFDLASVARRVHFAFRSDPDGAVGEHSTYSVRVDAVGRIAVTPRPRVAAAARPRGVTAHAGAACVLQTVSVARDAARVAVPPVRVQVADDGSLALRRSGVDERLRNGEDGLEQSWRFAQRPAGSGDLVVRVSVTGQAHVGATPLGLHFSDPASGLGVRYGAASRSGRNAWLCVLGFVALVARRRIASRLVARRMGVWAGAVALNRIR